MTNVILTGVKINLARNDAIEETPRIFWPTSKNGKAIDSSNFPALPYVRQKHQAGINALMSPTFFEATKVAENIIWILDHYILDEDENYERKMEYLENILRSSAANEVKFIVPKKDATRRSAETLLKVASNIRQKNDIRTSLNLEVRYYNSSKKSPSELMPHDRFAIIDKELWHFGATVAGLHNSLNAVTRGWSAELRMAKQFFDSVWESKDVSCH